MGLIKKQQKVMLISRVNYPVTINYLGKEVVIPPKGSTKRNFLREHLIGINAKELMIR